MYIYYIYIYIIYIYIIYILYIYYIYIYIRETERDRRERQKRETETERQRQREREKEREREITDFSIISLSKLQFSVDVIFYIVIGIFRCFVNIILFDFCIDAFAPCMEYLEKARDASCFYLDYLKMNFSKGCGTSPNNSCYIHF